MLVQLRTYTISQGALDEFAYQWETKIKPPRKKIGSHILGARIIRVADQFVRILGYDGLNQWEEMDNACHLSPERQAMQSDPARNFARIEPFLWIRFPDGKPLFLPAQYISKTSQHEHHPGAD